MLENGVCMTLTEHYGAHWDYSPAGHTCGRGVDGHVVSGVIQELGPGVPLNIVTVIVTPSQLHVNPVLVARLLVKQVILVCHQGGLGHGPLVGSEQQDVCTGGVHLVGLPGMNGLLLDSLNLQGVQLLVKDLASVGKARADLRSGTSSFSST